ncbi:MAG: hypothetical protein JOZ63_08450, partial [Planctomycetaceae bacterium]|nr:hypothetical protein [Planctomycetaceae bacterium]
MSGPRVAHEVSGTDPGNDVTTASWDFEAAILGAGAAGLVAAIRAAERGVRV